MTVTMEEYKAQHRKTWGEMVKLSEMMSDLSDEDRNKFTMPFPAYLPFYTFYDVFDDFCEDFINIIEDL